MMLIADERGLSLVEQLVTIALMGIILVTLLYALSGSSLGVGLVDERTTASALAASALETVRSSAYITGALAYTPTLAVPGGYSVTMTASPLITGLQFITATVYHYGQPVFQVANLKSSR